MMTLDRLMSKLISRATKRGDCLLVGDLNSDRRYWSVNYDGKRRNAHQAAWEHYNRQPIPDGFEVTHSCDNTRCIAESHLILGTHAYNMRDRDIKGRNNGRLTMLRAVAISVLVERGFAVEDIASEFEVSGQTVRNIHAGRTWSFATKTTANQSTLSKITSPSFQLSAA